MKIKIQDLSFIGDSCSSKYHKSKYFEWERSGNPPKPQEPIFFTDLALELAKSNLYSKAFKIAWLIEPAVISQSTYQFISQKWKEFDLVISHHKDFVKGIPNAKYYENRMCWVAKEDFKIYPKSKDISMFASGKNYTTGHGLRHKIIKDHTGFDVFGYGYRPVEHKVEGLKDYRFSIAIENCNNFIGYFTEKLIDCMVCGTIPIYWGQSDIGEYFDEQGIIQFKTLTDFADIINRLKDPLEAKKTYDEMFSHVENNFAIAQNKLVAEDYIWEQIIEPLVQEGKIKIYE